MIADGPVRKIAELSLVTAAAVPTAKTRRAQTDGCPVYSSASAAADHDALRQRSLKKQRANAVRRKRVGPAVANFSPPVLVCLGIPIPLFYGDVDCEKAEITDRTETRTVSRKRTFHQK